MEFDPVDDSTEVDQENAEPCSVTRRSRKSSFDHSTEYEQNSRMRYSSYSGRLDVFSSVKTYKIKQEKKVNNNEEKDFTPIGNIVQNDEEPKAQNPRVGGKIWHTHGNIQTDQNEQIDTTESLTQIKHLLKQTPYKSSLKFDILDAIDFKKHLVSFKDENNTLISKFYVSQLLDIVETLIMSDIISDDQYNKLSSAVEYLLRQKKIGTDCKISLTYKIAKVYLMHGYMSKRQHDGEKSSLAWGKLFTYLLLMPRVSISNNCFSKDFTFRKIQDKHPVLAKGNQFVIR